MNPGITNKTLMLAVISGLAMSSLANAAEPVLYEKGALILGDTSVTIGGYVRGDLLYTDNGVNAKNALLAAAHIKAADESKDNRIDLSARESRFFIKTSSTVDGKALKTHLEADFYGADGTETVSNSHGLRIRHAYGSWGNLLVGQTWSTFMDLDGLGDLNAFGQHPSAIFVRQAQLRYTQPLSLGSVMLAIENPEDGGDDNTTPDVVARLNVDGGWGHASVGVVSREISDGTDTKRAAAYSLTAKLPFANGDDIRLQYNAGALGRYMGLGIYPNDVAGATEVSEFESEGASIALRHLWSPTLASTLMYSTTSATDDSAEGAIDSADAVHVNLMWTASPRVRYGFEVSKWNVDVMTAGVAETKDLLATQMSARFMF